MNPCVNCNDPEATQSGPRGECNGCGYFWEEYPEYVPLKWQLDKLADSIAKNYGSVRFGG